MQNVQLLRGEMHMEVSRTSLHLVDVGREATNYLLAVKSGFATSRNANRLPTTTMYTRPLPGKTQQHGVFSLAP